MTDHTNTTLNTDSLDLRDSTDLRDNTGGVMTDELAKLKARVADLEDENAHLSLQLAIMSSTDVVTGLANRTGLVDSVEMALYRLQRMGEPFAVVGVRFLGLANLTMTEERIDAVRDLGALIAASLRNVDRVGRLDDATFAVILANVPADHVTTVTDRTRSLLSGLPARAGVDVELTAGLSAVSVVETPTQLQVADVFDAIEGMLDRSEAPVQFM
jgi:GGDEF domain-containing protein